MQKIFNFFYSFGYRTKQQRGSAFLVYVVKQNKFFLLFYVKLGIHNTRVLLLILHSCKKLLEKIIETFGAIKLFYETVYLNVNFSITLPINICCSLLKILGKYRWGKKFKLNQYKINTDIWVGK